MTTFSRAHPNPIATKPQRTVSTSAAPSATRRAARIWSCDAFRMTLTFTGPGGIVAGSLTIDGAGLVGLANSGNSYAGDTMVLAGTLHYDLVRANALKMSCTVGFAVASLAVFIARGQVAWVPAIVLAVATSLGSVLGVKYAIKADPKQLKRILAVLVVLACLGVGAQELWGS